MAVIRLPAMLQSVMGTDEGLYALVAREWLNGHLPYTTVWETKPPLFFALLAAAMGLFGKTVFAIRVASDVAVAATASALYAIGCTFRRKGRTIGVVAACCYAALTISDSGSSAVAELFYAPFMAAAFALILASSNARAGNIVRDLGIGACLAGAVLVKASAGLEALYATGVAVWYSGIVALLPIAGAATMLVLASVAPYVATHTTALYWDANVGAIARRAPVPVTDVAPWPNVVLAQVQAFFPATLLVLGIPRCFAVDDRRAIVAMFGWALASFATVASIREYLGNHFIGAMAPACVLAAIVTVRWAEHVKARALVPATIAVAILAHAGYQFVLAAPVAIDRLRSGDPTYGDGTAELAAYLNAQRAPSQTLYVADDRTVLYVLADATPPTRFAYPAHLLDRYQEIIAGVDAPAEIGRILATSPDYIVWNSEGRASEDPRGAELLVSALEGHYHAVFSVGSRRIYLRDR